MADPEPSPSADPDGRVTLAAYTATRASVAGSPATGAAVFDASLAYGLAALQGRISESVNILTLPPLDAAAANVLRAAARGETLAELDAVLPPAPAADVELALLQGVARRLWATADTRFESGFLAATDVASDWAADTAPEWSATALGPAWQDFGDVDQLELSASTRLTIGDKFELALAAPADAEIVEGVGAWPRGDLYTAPMLRLRGPGGRFTGAGYTAQGLWISGHLWLTVTPDAGSLETFAHDGLAPALAAAAQALAAPATLADSTQLWPLVYVRTPGDIDERMRATTAFDEVQADLSGLDGGGSFARSSSVDAELRIDLSGLALQGGQALAFNRSPLNVHGGGGSLGAIGSVTTVFDPTLPLCPYAEPDWRSAYLAVLDPQQRLVALAWLAAPLQDARECTTTPWFEFDGPG